MGRMGQQTEKKDKIYIEVVRFLAIMMVLYVHTSVNGLLYFYQGKENRSSQLAFFIYPVITGCVRLFFMISGALLLKKRESVGTVFRKRFSRFLVVTAVAVLIYYIRDGENLSVRGYFNSLYKGGSLTQHWFLYSYLAFLLILPFLQRMVQAISEDSIYWYLWGLGIVFQLVLPAFESLSGFDQIGLSIPVLEQIIFYPLLGYFIDSRVIPKYKDKRYLPVLIGIVLLITLTVNYFLDRQSYAADGILAYAYWFHGILIPGIYLLVALVFTKIPLKDWMRKVLIFLGNGVFGTYLLEQIIRDRLFFLLEKWVYVIPEYLACWLWILVCVMCGILITNVLKCIPILKKYL